MNQSISVKLRDLRIHLDNDPFVKWAVCRWSKKADCMVVQCKVVDEHSTRLCEYDEDGSLV